MKISYDRFMEENFMVIDRESQQPVPFRLNEVQKKYYEILMSEYPDQENVREIILKARQQGFSTFVLALFTVDFILRPHSISICISHRKDATEMLFKKVKFFLQSFCDKRGIELKDLLGSETKGMIENKLNNAQFYIGTAGAKVGGRGASARNIHFSEVAFYQDTELITAQEIIVGTSQQVPQGKGMIFLESTANGMDNYYQKEWERANLTDEHPDKSVYHPRFFGWQEFYSEEWVNEKRKDFPTDAMWKQEYPGDPDEAFISSGTPYFDNMLLKLLLDKRPQAIRFGRIAPDGEFA